MPEVSFGLLSPGEMGAAVGAALRGAGYDTAWVAHGRSDASRFRAESADLRPVATMQDLLAETDVVLSIVPPAAAIETAMQARGARVYVDANAISPATASQVAQIITQAGGTYVDGGIVGTPPSPSKAGATRLYLSGGEASTVADYLTPTIVAPRVITSTPFAASALKMAYAAWTKGSFALILGVLATATHHGVSDVLLDEWAGSKPELIDLARNSAHVSATKGWRWIAEMQEIAETFIAAGLHPGAYEAAAEIYRRTQRDPEAMADDATQAQVLQDLLGRDDLTAANES